MKHLKATLLVMAIFVSSPTISAQTVIDVLVMAEPNADASKIASQLAEVNNVMVASGTGVSIAYAFSGAPQVIPPMTGSDTVQHIAATTFAPAVALRNSTGADLVIVFVDELSGCGFAPADQWYGGNGINGTAPDTSGSEDKYVALVSTGTTTDILGNTVDCPDDLPYLAAHETGHLFGAGHEEDAIPPAIYLYNNSHADYTKPVPFPLPGIDGYYTVMHSVIPVECQITGFNCNALNKYSDLATATNGVYHNTNNRQAILDTKSSVTAYRVPGCSLTRPDPVFGNINNPCDPDPWTSHNMAWFDSCEDESEFYEIYAQQPAIWGGIDINYVHVWNTVLPWDEVFVKGGAANFRVKACNSSGCTGKSNTWYWADAICEGH